MTPRDLEVFDDGTGHALYVVSASGTVPSAWRWRYGHWQPIATGLGAYAGWLWVLDDGSGPALYAKTWAVSGGESHCRRWNGSQWVPTAPEFCTREYFPRISADLGDGLRIYGTKGTICCPPSPELAQVTRWTGQAWEVIAQTDGLGLIDLIAYDDGGGLGLFACGNFHVINGVPAGGFAVWRSGTWTALGSEFFPRKGGDFKVFDDGTGPGLYIRFGLNATTGLGSELVARWNGQAWQSVGGGVSNPNGFVGALSMEVFDDGTGPALYVGGVFSLAGTTPVKNIARWNGTTWSSPGAGTGAYVEQMAVLSDKTSRALFIGGDFINVGGGQSPDIARWVGCPNCYANCDGSTVPPRLNANDFMCFINRYVSGDPYANCSLDDFINAADFMCFMDRFAAGCR